MATFRAGEVLTRELGRRADEWSFRRFRATSVADLVFVFSTPVARLGGMDDLGFDDVVVERASSCDGYHVGGWGWRLRDEQQLEPGNGANDQRSGHL
jgi:hypothetical protein